MPSSDFRRANQLVRENRLEEAVAAYRSAIATNASLYIYYKNLGHALEKLGYLERAIESYREAINLHPQASFLYADLQRVYSLNGEQEKANQLKSKLFEKQSKIQKESNKFKNGEKLLENKELALLQSSSEQIKEYKNKHKGKRCVIIGNGPSLNKMDLSFLKNEITFGLNRIYLGFEKWNFIPTYYVAVNSLVIEQSIEQIYKIPCTKFISNRGIPYLKHDRNTIFIKTYPSPSMDFSPDPTEGLNEGGTVTYVAIQLAYYMGFQTVILIGVDHYFSTQGAPHQEIESQNYDSDHFHPNYFGKGIRWQLPDLRMSEQYYKIALGKFWINNRVIIDATVDGKCPVFDKKNYKELFF